MEPNRTSVSAPMAKRQAEPLTPRELGIDPIPRRPTGYYIKKFLLNEQVEDRFVTPPNSPEPKEKLNDDKEKRTPRPPTDPPPIRLLGWNPTEPKAKPVQLPFKVFKK